MYQRKPTVTKNCLTCGKEFTTSTSSKLYCGKRCAKIAQKKRYDASRVNHPPITRECPTCHKTFIAKYNNQRYCSETCKEAKTYIPPRAVAQKEDKQLCWKCANTNENDCPWFAEDQQLPEGAVARPSYVSMCIVSCPNFKKWERKKTTIKKEKRKHVRKYKRRKTKRKSKV